MNLFNIFLIYILNFQNFISGYSSRRWLNEIQDKIMTSIGPQFQGVKSVALLDIPDHWNLGDSFIWLGERIFFERMNITTVVERFSNWNPSEITNAIINKNGIISMHGGGNLGDLYQLHQNLRQKAFENFKGKKIVVFPQSVYFAKSSNFLDYGKTIKKYSNITIFCRCNESLKQMKSIDAPNINFLLAPDMAFLIGDVLPVEEPTYDVVFLCRSGEKKSTFSNNKEFLAALKAAKVSVLVVDWYAWNSFIRKNEKIPNGKDKNLCDYRLELAKRILSKGKVIVSDRMHAIILSMLMNKPVIALDNIYDKFGRVYDSFLSKYSKEELKLERASSFKEAENIIKNILSKKI